MNTSLCSLSADMGWTFQWRLVPNKKCTLPISPALIESIQLRVKALPEPKTHNLIHIEGDVSTRVDGVIDPRVEAMGVSGRLGRLGREIVRTSKAYTTFSLSATIDGPRISWEWHKTEQSVNIRDPDLTYEFAFKFDFQEPVETLSRVASNGGDQQGMTQDDRLAIEISIHDFTVTFGAKYPFRQPRTLMSNEALSSFRSDECHVDMEPGWPVPGVKHRECSACET